MKISVYLKKCSATTSNICFRVREKNVDIKVVSPSRSMTSIGIPIPYVTGERLP